MDPVTTLRPCWRLIHASQENPTTMHQVHVLAVARNIHLTVGFPHAGLGTTVTRSCGQRCDERLSLETSPDQQVTKTRGRRKGKLNVDASCECSPIHTHIQVFAKTEKCRQFGKRGADSTTCDGTSTISCEVSPTCHHAFSKITLVRMFSQTSQNAARIAVYGLEHQHVDAVLPRG